MRLCKMLLVCGCVIAGMSATLSAQGIEPKPNGRPAIFSFKDGGDKLGEFLLNGKPFQIRSAEIHPQRVPRAYWRHRIRMAKAMGLNTIAFYVFWNAIELPNGKFDFSGENDVAAWLKLCAEEKMWVLFRPGPYVCGEWDLGGLPVSLLKDPKVGLRTTKDANFIKAQDRYFKVLAKIAKPFLCKNGGPILMTQLENEYGSYYRREAEYMKYLQKFWTEQGFAPFYTSDGAGDHFLKGIVLPGVAVGLDPGENDGAFEAARRNNPGVPVFSSETYPGWLRHWGEGNWRPTNKTNAIDWFMKKGYSFNIFVFHGGSNFGFTAGANDGGKGKYQPDLTSYDYGSPCDEQGCATAEYKQYRDKISSHLGELPEAPAPIPAMEIPPFTPEFFAPLRAGVSKPLTMEEPQYFEFFDQNQGMGFYSTELPAGEAGKLTFENVNDYAHVFLNGTLLATLDRREGQKSVDIPARDKPSVLEVQVEAMGHINFGSQLEHDRKGVYGAVKLNGVALKNWKLKRKTLSEKSICAAARRAPQDAFPGGHFRGEFTLMDTVADTFLDMSKWGKGTVYVNGHNLGRYWRIGPQLRLFCPAPWLKKGRNVIDIVEVGKQSNAMPIRGYKTRNYDMNAIKTSNADNQW